MDCPHRMSPHEVAAARTLGWQFYVEQIDAIAENWLVDGWDTPALRELVASKAAHERGPRLWRAALDELGLTTPAVPEAHHLLASGMVGRWPAWPLPKATQVDRLRAILVHGALSRGGAALAWPIEDTFRALGHLGARLGAADASGETLTAVERQLADDVRRALGDELSGNRVRSGSTLLASVDNRRLVFDVPGFVWEDVDLHDEDCGGECQTPWSVARWVATAWTTEPRRRPLSAMADGIDDLLSNVHRPAASSATGAFLYDLYTAARTQGITSCDIAEELGPVARKRWSDIVDR